MSDELKPCIACQTEPLQSLDGSKCKCSNSYCYLSHTFVPVWNWNTRHITRADIPESIVREIKAGVLEELAFSVGLFWVRNMFGGADPGQILARVREFFRKQAAKLREGER